LGTFICLNKKCKNKFDVPLPVNPRKYPCPKCWSSGVKEIFRKDKFARGLTYKGIGER